MNQCACCIGAWRPPLSYVCVMVLCIILLPSLSSTALGFQEHGPTEGMYVHQLAHIFFGLSMAGLWSGIRRSRFSSQPSWQLIATGAALLTLWNVMTFSGHILSHFILLHAQESSGPSLHVLWKVLKLDNIVCVSAMFCFYFGLRKMLASIMQGRKAGGLDRQRSL